MDEPVIPFVPNTTGANFIDAYLENGVVYTQNRMIVGWWLGNSPKPKGITRPPQGAISGVQSKGGVEIEGRVLPNAAIFTEWAEKRLMARAKKTAPAEY